MTMRILSILFEAAMRALLGFALFVTALIVAAIPVVFILWILGWI